MAKIPLRLYVWTEFYVDYYAGLAFAIAQSEDEAKELIVNDLGYPVPDHEWGELEIVPLTDKIARAVSGGG